LEIKTTENTDPTPTSNYGMSSSSGSSHRSAGGEVLGASTSLNDQTVLQLKLIECLNEMIKLLQLYVKILKS
jgi:hypothetical protein